MWYQLGWEKCHCFPRDIGQLPAKGRKMRYSTENRSVDCCDFAPCKAKHRRQKQGPGGGGRSDIDIILTLKMWCKTFFVGLSPPEPFHLPLKLIWSNNYWQYYKGLIWNVIEFIMNAINLTFCHYQNILCIFLRKLNISCQI